jgi:hypothetical protein
MSIYFLLEILSNRQHDGGFTELYYTGRSLIANSLRDLRLHVAAMIDVIVFRAEEIQ